MDGRGRVAYLLSMSMSEAEVFLIPPEFEAPPQFDVAYRMRTSTLDTQGHKNSMDITSFVSARRETLLIADYNTYRTQLSRQILSTRKRLGRATPKREKYGPKAVTAEDVGSNHEFAHLLLLTSERAWAHAMHIKTTHTEDASGKGITGATRRHVISRLAKAAKVARNLLGLLGERNASKASSQDVLEGRAYAASLGGAEEFEKESGGEQQAGEKRWHECLKQYSEARIIYAALYERDKKDVYRDILANTVDPTIRYAAYQAHLSRTIAIPTVAKRFFPKDDSQLVKAIEEVDSYALKDKPVPKTEEEKQDLPQAAPSSVTWRGRKASIVDASIGQALASVSTAEARLRSYLSSNTSAANKDKAGAYDEILVSSQDAADATKRATDELEKERVDEGDARMQDLRVTSLAVNYALVSWRVGRNRALVGAEDDGMTFESQAQKKLKRPRKDGTEYPDKEEGRGHKLARLRERVVLYDASIQSVNSVKELRGAMRDQKFVDELDAKANYFRALKCLNISFSHSLLGNHLNSLALLKRAQDLLDSHTLPKSSSDDSDAPPTLDIPPSAGQKLHQHITSVLLRTQALVELHNLESASAAAASKNAAHAPPLVRNLTAYPVLGTQVDLTNLVSYPPKLEPVPVKPLFLDVAWNYIEYPGRQMKTADEKKPVVNDVQPAQEEPQKKKGWFGFGR
ncbi:signal recognition particle subunit srp68 [Extremus antarcticus]|uniref:Signal recognition particle subunit SRP68 n=1 Tax=Extremus antarcticus TaxID=702011 RepID=A0AAJ0GFU8_9PEZI|nr:signal recognition particle subunit srp68 [Extremus antarcticus]